MQSRALLNELTELGFQGSQRTFYRGLTRHRLLPPGRQRPQPRDQAPQESPGIPRLPAYTRQPTPVLPRSVTPLTGEALISYLNRLACANHLTLTDVLTVLPS